MLEDLLRTIVHVLAPSCFMIPNPWQHQASIREAEINTTIAVTVR